MQLYVLDWFANYLQDSLLESEINHLVENVTPETVIEVQVKVDELYQLIADIRSNMNFRHKNNGFETPLFDMDSLKTERREMFNQIMSLKKTWTTPELWELCRANTGRTVTVKTLDDQATHNFVHGGSGFYENGYHLYQYQFIVFYEKRLWEVEKIT
jgi:hypothetical protein